VHRILTGGTVVSYVGLRPVYLFMILSIISYQQGIDNDEKLRTFQLIRQNIGLHGIQKGKQEKLLKYLKIILSLSYLYGQVTCGC